MNKMKFKYIYLLIVGMVMFMVSCDKYLDINIDPNQSTISRVDLQLSSAQLQTAIGLGQRIFPRVSTLCQYHTGGPGVALTDEDQHKWAPSESNEVFRTCYRSTNSLSYILKNSTESYYIAIAKIMTAYNFGICADLFGNIPFDEAVRGDIADGSILHPNYDNAKDVVYPGAERLLLEAIDLINNGGVVLPADDDLVYGGNMDNWSKFAHTLLLKMYLRQGASGQQKAADLYQSDDQFIIDNSEMAAVAFPGGSQGSNPFWNAAKSTALGNFYVGTTTMIDYLGGTQDPRLDAYFDTNNAGIQIGLYPGDIQNASSNASFSVPAGALAANGGLMFGPTLPVIFMSAWEGNLLLAEAASRGWITTDANAAYEAAVNASFDYLGLDPADAATYLAGAGAMNAGDPIKSIALQKWVCMFEMQPVESWIEVRRFDSSSTPYFTSPGGVFSSPTENALGTGKYPSILPYPENEESLNQNFPGQHPITDKVFWDN
ncbi:MAG: SusD/RagB family nutrient-binding outer membrane lipoprotein [Saprospiraceae bacterium]|nr:SusD/RagB family nutrient-binding outer membrane lipoprotein [Saprospiraceae bacterium]MCB9345734.1 SusD/RagB family nutrient-binding outer membrane lipoprotein [Lewinellaceae bacterium]